MKKLNICIKKLNGIIIHYNNYSPINEQLSATIQAEIMNLGYMMDQKLFEAISQINLSEKEIEKFFKSLITELREIKGFDVGYDPFYPNFPEQVMEKSEVELFINSFFHYLSQGSWKPTFPRLPRKFAFEKVNFRKLTLATQDDFNGILPTLLASNDSLSAEDKEIVLWFLKNREGIIFPKDIPYKETLCMVVSYLFENQILSINASWIKTATDVLRIIVSMSGGDISLTTNTKIKSLPRKIRRQLVSLLESVIKEDDVRRHKKKWGKVFHSLHIGEYQYAKKCNIIAQKIRSNKKLFSYRAKVQGHIEKNEIEEGVNFLKKTPGEFARKIDHLLRLSSIEPEKKEIHRKDLIGKHNNNDKLYKNNEIIENGFKDVVDDVSTRVLLQLMGHLIGRSTEVDLQRVVFPKGNIQRAQLIPPLTKIDSRVVSNLQDIVENSLVSRFSKLEELGKVYIDKELLNCPIPTQMRSASKSMDVVARGTSYPLSKDYIRMFIYWIGSDIDLSATFHNEKFEMLEKVSYTNLKSTKYNSCHSGDITSAKNGASEFVDIDIQEAAKYSRYVIMNVLVYSGPTFKEHKKVYAGFMSRTHIKSNEIFEPKTVENKLDVTVNSKNAIPFIFDLHEKKVIYIDLSTRKNEQWGGNNIESNAATIVDILKSIKNLYNKFTLYELFTLHGFSRGTIVENKDEADIIFDLEKGTVTPKDINIINSEYVI